jgi:hypothetical protein
MDDLIKEMNDFWSFDNFLAYTFKLSTALEEYNRSYIKINHIAANTDGVVQAISIICALISFSYNKSHYYRKIINELFLPICKKDSDNLLKKF